MTGTIIFIAVVAVLVGIGVFLAAQSMKAREERGVASVANHASDGGGAEDEYEGGSSP